MNTPNRPELPIKHTYTRAEIKQFMAEAVKVGLKDPKWTDDDRVEIFSRIPDAIQTDFRTTEILRWVEEGLKLAGRRDLARRLHDEHIMPMIMADE